MHVNQPLFATEITMVREEVANAGLTTRVKHRRTTCNSSWPVQSEAGQVKMAARSTRPPLLRSNADFAALGEDLNIFSRRCHVDESALLDEEAPFALTEQDDLALDRSSSSKRSSVTAHRGLKQMPSLTSLSSYIRRTSLLFDLDNSPPPIHPHLLPSLDNTPIPFPPHFSLPPSMISPTDSSFSDASSSMLPTPTSSEFPPLVREGRESGDEVWVECEDEAEWAGAKSPVAREGSWGRVGAETQ